MIHSVFNIDRRIFKQNWETDQWIIQETINNRIKITLFKTIDTETKPVSYTTPCVKGISQVLINICKIEDNKFLKEEEGNNTNDFHCSYLLNLFL